MPSRARVGQNAPPEKKLRIKGEPVFVQSAQTVAPSRQNALAYDEFVPGKVQYLFNYLAHARYLTTQEGQLVVNQGKLWLGTPYELVGPDSQNQIAGDCSGTTFKIYDSVGDRYSYVQASNFGTSADQEGFPFQRLAPNVPPQPGDVLQFEHHVAIYAGQNAQGNDIMLTASTSKQAYVVQQVKNFGQPVIGVFRYQVPTQ